MRLLSNDISIIESFKNGSIETGYFTKMFYLKKDESCIQRMNKKHK